MASAAASADEGGRVGADAGRGCRAASVDGAWPPRGVRALAWSGRDAREWARRSAGQAGRGARLGRTRGAREAGAAAGRAGFGHGQRREAAARERRNHFSQFPFLRNF